MLYKKVFVFVVASLLLCACGVTNYTASQDAPNTTTTRRCQMCDNDDNHGFWYWMTLSKPSNYFLAKSLGGDAEKQADAALEDMGPAFVILIVIVIVVLVVYGIGKLFKFW